MTRLLSEGGPDSVALLLVGDELLLGTVSDTNGAWMAATLRERGWRVVETRAVPDDAARIARAVVDLARRAAVVITSGGLGPTSDDLTREALADACGSPLVVDERAAASIAGWYRSRGRAPGEAAQRMARRPAAAELLVNPHGSAPGLRVELDTSTVYAVPGVPSELRSMVSEVVLVDLESHHPDRLAPVSTSVEVALLGESAVVGMLAGVEADAAAAPDVDIAYLARPAHVSVRISVRPDGADAVGRCAEWTDRVVAALGHHVLGANGVTLAEVVLGALIRRGETVATAESLTGGAVSAALTAVPGASAAVRGGMVVYATDLKHAWLSVPAALLAEQGPVDDDVAAAMAEAARTRASATWGVATTGVAGPEPVGPHPAGTVIVAVSGPEATTTARLDLPGDRARVRRLAVAHALDALRHRLGEWESPAPLDR